MIYSFDHDLISLVDLLYFKSLMHWFDYDLIDGFISICWIVGLTMIWIIWQMCFIDVFIWSWFVSVDRFCVLMIDRLVFSLLYLLIMIWIVWVFLFLNFNVFSWSWSELLTTLFQLWMCYDLNAFDRLICFIMLCVGCCRNLFCFWQNFASYYYCRNSFSFFYQPNWSNIF